MHHCLQAVLFLLKLNFELKDDLHLDASLGCCAVVHAVLGIQMSVDVNSSLTEFLDLKRFYFLDSNSF